MTLNPIKVVNFKGEFVRLTSEVKVKVVVNTEHCNLNIGTWQICLKDFSYKCENALVASAKPCFLDFKTNMITFEDENYSTFYSHLARCYYKGVNADTMKFDQVWYNVNSVTQEPVVIINSHNLSTEEKLKHTFQFQVTVLFRRVL